MDFTRRYPQKAPVALGRFYRPHQFIELNNQLGFDTTDPAEAQRELNRITLALIDLIEKM